MDFDYQSHNMCGEIGLFLSKSMDNYVMVVLGLRP